MPLPIAMRATSQNPQIAGLMGVDINKVISFTFVVGAALGAIFLIVAGEFLRPTGELATFIVSAVALLVVLFFPGGFLGAALSREARS